MARYPSAQYRALGRQTEKRMSRHNILCFHTMVGSLRGTDAYFRDRGYYGVESHFGVGNDTDGSLDGVVYQWQDTAYRADANLDGKPEVISIETADGRNPNDPWSPKALDALVKLGIWVCKTHNIPPVLIPDTQPGRRGIGYHRMGCDHSSSYRAKGWPYDKWREPGGVKWSGVLGKTCPGDVRIKQLVDIVIPRIKAGVEGKEDDMPLSNADVDKVWDDKDKYGVSARERLAVVSNRATAAQNNAAKAAAEVEAARAEIAAHKADTDKKLAEILAAVKGQS